MGIGVRVVHSRNVPKQSGAAAKGETTTIPTVPVAPLQAGSLRSGSISHLNKHGPAEDGGEFFRGVKETAPLNETIEAGEFSDTAAWLGFTRLLNKRGRCVWTLKFVTEPVGVCSASEQTVVF